MVDSAGYIYVVGFTTSTNFPTAGAYDSSFNGVTDVFVSKFSPTGNSLIYSTYIGGANEDRNWGGLAVDSSGNAYISGQTLSTNFPTANAYDSTKDTDWDAFVTKLNAAGNGLVFSTYLGGNSYDAAYDLALGGTNAFVAGETYSSNFPTVGAYDATQNGGGDAFIAKFSITGTVLVYSTYLGGTASDVANGLAVDASGNAYVTGDTASTNFPTASAYDATDNTGADIFVTKLNASGNGLTYSTYFGGNGLDSASDIAIDSSNQAYVTGYTTSSDFPLANPIQNTRTLTEAYVSKFNSAGNGLTYSTYFGGNGGDYGFGLAVDSAGQAYVTGGTSSTNLATQNPIQAAAGGGGDIFIVKVNTAGNAFLLATYLGGSSEDTATALTVKGQTSVYLTGSTSSTAFPTVYPRQGAKGSLSDAFVVRIDEIPLVSYSTGAYTATENSTAATITVTLSSPLGLTATVAYTASNGTALASSDFISRSGVLTFTPDVTVLTFTVPITNDSLDELDEFVNLVLGNPVSVTLGTPITSVLTIIDDDATPQLQFTSGTYTVTENTSPATLTVTLSAASSLTATVNYTTSNRTALAGSDYTSTAGLLSFPPGVVTQTISIPLINDAVNELVETLGVTLTSPTSATLGTPFTATVAIVDDDVSVGSTGDVISYTYDAFYRLTRADYNDGRYFVYAYDAVGNRLSEVACSSSLPCAPITTTYSYDDANRLVSVNGQPYIWDANGSLVADGVLTYTYDAANRLITVTQGLTLATGFAYNGLGDRVSQVANGVVTTYTLDLAGGLTQVLADGTHTYLYGKGRIAQATLTQTEYFLGDALGSVRQLVDSSGQVTLEHSYEPFGDVRHSSGTSTTSYDFTGEWRDGSGLIYLRARYNASPIGRFIQADTWSGDHANPQSLNRFTYSLSNPVNRTDPSGHFTCDGSDNCQKIFLNWLDILKSQGGDSGAELARAFLVADTLVTCEAGPCNMFTDRLHISIVASLEGGGSMRANTSRNIIEVSQAAFESANIGGDDLLVKVGEFGHEIRHLQQGALLQSSLHSEVDAYDVQYQLYTAFGLEIENSPYSEVQSAVAVHNQLVGVSNYELINSGFATEVYKGTPLFKPLWWLDAPIRCAINWWHDIWAD